MPAAGVGAPGRYPGSGHLDPAFGGVGRGRVVVSDVDQLVDLACQSNGGIVGVGRADGRAVVLRLRPDGTREAGFGTRTLSGPGAIRAFGYALTLQGDGKILIAGATADAAGSDIGLWRLLPSGELDQSFGIEGFATFGVPGFAEYGFDVAVDLQGRVLVAGHTSNGDDMVLVRFTGSGAPDRTFNELDGTGVPYFQIVTTGYAAAHKIAVQQDGKILITGVDHHATGLPVYRIVPGEAGMGVAGLDSTFGGGDGLAVVDGLHPIGTGLSLQRDGGIVAVGMNTEGGSGLGTAVRLTPDGVVDPTFGSGTGVPIRIPDDTGGFLTAVEALPGGDVMVAGLTESGDEYRPFVARVNRRGDVDQSMGPGGARLLNRRDTDVAGMALQADGRILVAGITRSGTSSYAGVIYRFLGPGAAPTREPGRRRGHGPARSSHPRA
jgi:uncharacterized delta-60 repeat protein